MAPPKGVIYNVNGLGGRPREYTDEIIEKYADEMLEYMSVPTNMFMNKFLLERGIVRERYNEWKKRNNKFRDTYLICHQLQEERIKEGTLFKTYDSNMARFILVNNHGYAEKTETKISGDANNPLSFIIDNISSSKELVNGDKE